nr:hypothetical protein HmN_000930200 [Hymenolepis microstoma]
MMDKVCKPVKSADFPANSNDTEQNIGLKVVSKVLDNCEKKEGPTRLESRMKTIHNDDDLRYLRELYLDPWKEGFFNAYESTSSFERRSILMCPEGPEDCYRPGKVVHNVWLSKYLSVLKQSSKCEANLQFDQADVEKIIVSFLRQTRTIKFDKLFERLPLRLPGAYEINQSDLLTILKKIAILIHGWWCIKSEFLYPPQSISEFEGHPREVMINARDYAMAVFHRGGKLTSKFLTNLTRIHISEAKEILKWLGVRSPPQNGDLSRYWVFREPEREFIQRYPSVLHQQEDWWNIRIRQLCQQFKMEELAWSQSEKIDKTRSNTVQPVSQPNLSYFASLHDDKSQPKHFESEDSISSSSNLQTGIVSITNGNEQIHSNSAETQVNMDGVSRQNGHLGDANPGSPPVELIQPTPTHKNESEMLLYCNQVSTALEGGSMSVPKQSDHKSVSPTRMSSENVRLVTAKKSEEGCSVPLDTENPPSKQSSHTENARNSIPKFSKRSLPVIEEQVLEALCPTLTDSELSANESVSSSLTKKARFEEQFLNGMSSEKNEILFSKSVLQPPDMDSESCLLLSPAKEIRKKTESPQDSLNVYDDYLSTSLNSLSKGKLCNGHILTASQTERVEFGNDPTELDAPINVDNSSASTEARLLLRRPLESSSSVSNFATPFKRPRLENNLTSQVGRIPMHADQTSTRSEDGRLTSKITGPSMLDIKPIPRKLVDEPQIEPSFCIDCRVVAEPSKNLLKSEPPSLNEDNHSSKPSKVVHSDAADPRIVELVKSRLNSHPIISLSEMTKGVQPYLSSFSNSMSAGDNRPPVGSEVERQVLSSLVHKILLAEGAQELNIQWPDTSHCSVAASKQPLFVPPPTLEYTDPQDPSIRVRNIILKLLEEKPCVQFGEVKKGAINDGIKWHDGKLRDVIKMEVVDFTKDLPELHYAFTELHSLSEGRHNIIAVVKFFRPPRKTAGSGFSMFASVSDPSLKGEKIGITFIRSPGDVIIIHRLKVSKFRGKLQGCATEYIGSAAAVFPGDVANPISPYDSICKCSFSNEDLARVAELKNWYNSPECPIEKEALPVPRESSPNKDMHNLTRFHDIKPNSFFNTDAEVVGVYTYPEDQTKDLILCLWDGEPSADSQNLPFFNHLDLERPPSIERMAMDPQLVCITGHSLHPSESDWSVCVFVFDEHAVAARNLKPGDLIRLCNAHCVLKYDVSRPFLNSPRRKAWLD